MFSNLTPEFNVVNGVGEKSIREMKNFVMYCIIKCWKIKRMNVENFLLSCRCINIKIFVLLSVHPISMFRLA